MMLNKLLDSLSKRKRKAPSNAKTCESPVLSTKAAEFVRVASLSPGSYSVPAFISIPEKEYSSAPQSAVTVEVTPVILGRTSYSSSSTDMSGSPSPSGSGPDPLLSVFVLLPSSAHKTAQHGPLTPAALPPRLSSRQSGSSVVTLDSLKLSPQAATSEQLESPDPSSRDDVMASNRRLSLAPGIGAGTQTRSPRLGDTSFKPLSRTTQVPPGPKTAPPFGSTYRMSDKPQSSLAVSQEAPAAPPAFGSRSGPRGAPARRRPNTATVTEPRFQTQSGRGSMALPSGMGLGLSAGGKNRPGWEGDEVVGMLRNSGMEVTVIRNSSHLPSILTPKSTTSPTIPSFSSSTMTSADSTPQGPPTPVILVPLGDSPTLPSLSLLLSQGTTTTTAVCFQQDLLDRARRTEEEWLPSAAEQIRVVIRMRDQASSDGRAEKPIILAYSANPALSSTTIGACVDAGASGVLKPPYDLETARLVRRMARAAKEGKISSVVGMPTSASPTHMAIDDPALNVVLTPTALYGGGEHEAERVLSSARGKMSAAQETSPPPISAASRRQQPRRELPSLVISAAERAAEAQLDAEMDNLTFALYQPSLQRRRRSVDTGGLATAMKRAQKAFDVAANPITITPYSAASPASGSKQAMTPGPVRRESAATTAEDDDTQLAELLGAMYYQTCVAIDVQMEEYAELSAPLSPEQRSSLVDALATWDFKPHRLDDGDLFRVACLIFEGILHIEGIRELGCDRDQVNRLLFAMKAIYHAPNPYHNYMHAIDVLQATYTFLVDIGVAPPWSFIRDLKPETPAWKQPDETVRPVHGLGTRRAREVLRPQDILALIIAAMGHDVGHPGLSNAFMKNAKTPLSQVYDDKSVLENMHCMLVVQLLRKHGFGFLLAPPDSPSSNPARAEFDCKGFRKVLYSSVLATDMSLHFAWIARLKDLGARVDREEIGTKSGEEGEREVESDRIMLCQAVIKCADISNPTRPIDVSEHWSTVLLEEWAKQASLETDLSLPVSVIASADQALQAKGQIGFIDLFTQPLFEAFSDVVPEIQRYADSCAENRGLWSRRLESLQGDESTPVVQPVIANASVDDRFRTLFPLSLPVSLVSLSCLEPGPLPPSLSTSDGTSMSTMGPSTPVRSPATALQTPPSSSSFSFGTSPTSSYSPTAKAMRAVYHANLLDQRHRLAKEGKGVPIPGVNVLVDAARRASTPDAHAVTTDDGRFGQQFLRS